MAKQTINIGTIANDGTGDTLRQAGSKINANFTELYAILGGDSAGSAGLTRLTDSGFDFVGTTQITKVAFTEHPSANLKITFPDSNGTLLLDSATQTLTNKTISVDNNTISGIAATSFVLSNASGNINGSAAQKAIPTGVVVGTTDTQTMSNKTLDSAVMNGPRITGTIHDLNNAEMLQVSPAGSAVNYLKMSNAATAGRPSIVAVGTDSDISLDLKGKNRGAVILEKEALGSQTLTADGPITKAKTYIICNKGSTLNLSMVNGTVVGEVKIITNKGAGDAIITPSNLAGTPTTITIQQYESVQCIWDGTNWYVIGGNGYALA